MSGAVKSGGAREGALLVTSDGTPVRQILVPLDADELDDVVAGLHVRLSEYRRRAATRVRSDAARRQRAHYQRVQELILRLQRHSAVYIMDFDDESTGGPWFVDRIVDAPDGSIHLYPGELVP